MNTPNVLSGSTPLNPVLAMPNLPAPQVISGVLGQEGAPTPINPPLNLASILGVDTSTFTDVIASFTIDTSMNVGTNVFSSMLPVMRGATATFNERGDVTTYCMNWANVQLCSHMFYNPIQHIGFVVIAPEPVKGKLLVVFNPSEVLVRDQAPQYDPKRRMITEEWDLAESKTYFRTYLPNGLINQMCTEEQPLPRVPEDSPGDGVFVSPGYYTPNQFRHFGRLSVFIEQEIQVGSIFPKTYTVIAFTCFAGSKFSVPIDPRRAAYSNGKDSLICAHNNYLSARFNGNPPPHFSIKKAAKTKKDTTVKPKILPKPIKFNNV